MSVTGLVERVEEIYVAKWHIKKSEKKSPLPNSLGESVCVCVAFKNESGLHYCVVMKKAGKLLARYTCKLILTTGCKPSFQRHKRNE